MTTIKIFLIKPKVCPFLRIKFKWSVIILNFGLLTFNIS